MPPLRKSFATLAVLLGLTALAVLQRDGRALIALVVASAALLGLHAQRRWPSWARGTLVAFFGASLVRFVAAIVEKIHDNLDEVPEWDFMGFWLHARSAVAGLNFYDARTLGAATGAMKISWEFRTEIVRVGFWYPPPSMFFFLPLGWFDSAERALVFWYAVQIVVLGAAVVLAWKLLFPEGGAVELAGCVTLACAVHGTLLTFHYGQTNFIALLALLLFWRRRETLGGGIWAAVALFAKPFLAVLAVWMLVEARWRALLGFTLAVVGLMLASVVAFGPETVGDYFVGDQLGVKPDWIYSQPTNQSLLGWVLRKTDAECSGTQCVLHPLFLAGAAVLGAVTLALAVRLRRSPHGEWSLALLLAYALLVYPVSQLFYSVVLIPTLVPPWRHRERIAGGASTVALVAGAVCALCALRNGRQTFLAFAIVWAALAWVGLALVRGRGWPLRAGQPAGPAPSSARSRSSTQAWYLSDVTTE